MKKILFIGSFKIPRHGYYGGVNFACRSLQERFLEKGILIEELDTTIKDIKRQGVFCRLPGLLVRSLKFAGRILISFNTRYMLVFISAGNSYLDKMPVITLAALLRKKVILFPRSGHLLRDYEKPFYAFFINSTFRMAHYIICQSEFWKNYFELKGVPVQKLVVVENWVPGDTIRASGSLSFNCFRPSDSNCFKMVFVSRIEKDKGVDDIIEAAKKLKSDFNFEINIYGAGRYLHQFLDLIKKNNLEELVKYRGWLNREDMQAVINKHHLALFPSRFEGYPNAMLDYIFSKVPVLASNIPSVTAVGEELVTHYTPGDTGELAQQILYCKNNHGKVAKDAQKLYNQKYAKNSIDYAFGKILPLLT